jgi:hypothetical protein
MLLASLAPLALQGKRGPVKKHPMDDWRFLAGLSIVAPNSPARPSHAALHKSRWASAADSASATILNAVREHDDLLYYPTLLQDKQ